MRYLPDLLPWNGRSERGDRVEGRPVWMARVPTCPDAVVVHLRDAAVLRSAQHAGRSVELLLIFTACTSYNGALSEV